MNIESSTESSTVAPPRVFHLAAGGSSLTPASDAPELQLPSHVSGLAAFYYWKDAIVVGSYAHPSGRFSIDITRDRLDGYTANFRRMRENGVGVPILMDHAASAAATLGWIVDVRRDGDRLMELHQFLGEDARDIGLRNQVSLGIDPDYVDGKGARYGEAIVHSAVTPVPVVPGQGTFEAVEMSADEMRDEVLTLSLQTRAEAEGAHLAPGEDAGGYAANTEPRDREDSLDEAVPSDEEPGHDGRGAVSTSHVNPPCIHGGLNGRVGPSAPVGVGAPAPVLQLAMSALVDAAAAKRDLAVARGGLAPAVADELFALLVRSSGGQVNTLMLSRGGHDNDAGAAPIALAVFDALSRNRPVPLGEMTGLQVLSRLVPGDDAGAARLQERMIALASGRGRAVSVEP